MSHLDFLDSIVALRRILHTLELFLTLYDVSATACIRHITYIFTKYMCNIKALYTLVYAVIGCAIALLLSALHQLQQQLSITILLVLLVLVSLRFYKARATGMQLVVSVLPWMRPAAVFVYKSINIM